MAASIFNIRVTVDPTAAVAGTKKVEQSLVGLENRARVLRRTFTRTFAALAGGAVLVAAIRGMAQFEDQIALAGAVARATGDDLDQMREKALELGATTRFSATQAAGAFVNLSRAGFTVNESLSAIQSTLDFAVAGSIDLARASDIAATAVRGFGLQAEDTGRAVDVLTAASNRTNTTVDQLAEGLKFVAPVSAALGRSIEETSAALGVLADAGLKATLGGTGLRTILAKLASPSDALRGAVKQLGLTLEQVNPATNKLVDIMERLAPVANDAGLAFEIFDRRGTPAFLNLARNTGKLRAMNDQLDRATGTTKDVADVLNNTLNGALFRARSAFDALNQAFGQAGGSTFLVNFLDTVTASVRFLAANADKLVTILTVLAGIMAVNMVRALAAATIGVQGLTVRMLAMNVALLRIRATMLAAAATGLLTNPWTLAAVAVAGLIIHVQRYARELQYVGKVMDQVAKDAEESFNAQGAVISNANRELEKLSRIREKQGKLSASQAKREEQLIARQYDAAAAARQTAEEQAKANAARQAALPSIENTIKKLDAEGDRLRNISTELATQAQLEEEIAFLLQNKINPTAQEKNEIRLRIERNAQLKRERDILDSVQQPLRDYKANIAAIDSLLARGSISQGQYNVLLQKFKDELNGLAEADTPKGPETSLDRLREQNNLLRQELDFGKQSAIILDQINQRRREGKEITDEVVAEITREVQQNEKLNQKLAQKNELLAEAQRQKERDEKALDRLRREINSQKELGKELERLKFLRDQREIDEERYSQLVDQVRLKQLRSATDLEAGFERAFLKMKAEANDFAAVGEKIVTAFADHATDAIVDFANTGQFEFKKFANAVLQDILRILVRLLVMQALTAALGGVFPGATAPTTVPGISGAREHGGTMQPNRSYLVGENGPEIVTPGRTSAVTPSKATQEENAKGGQPNVQVVVVQDPSEIPRMIETDPSTERSILAVIKRNPSVIKNL